MASDEVIRVFLVNGESRSLRVDERTDSTDVIRFILRRLHVNMEYSAKLFGLQLKHTYSHDYYWLQPDYTIFELLDQYCTTKPMEEWRFLLRIRVLPKTAQHLSSQDPVAFQYFYDQVLHLYLEDDSVQLDSETAVKLGCLELRRFYKDMPQIALKKKENFSILEREIGLEKFFKRSLLETIRKGKLRSLVVSAFEQFESLSMDGCMFQFFNLLAKQYPLDVEQFSNCSIGERQDGQSNDLTCAIFVGPNCDVEYQSEGGTRRFLAAFNDINEISYEPEFTTRGKVVLELRQNSQSIVIHTAVLVNAVHLATLINGYCMMYTTLSHSRITGGKRMSNSSRLSGMYNPVDELRAPLPIPNSYGDHPDDYAEVREHHHRSSLSQFGTTILPNDVIVGERIGEGQFGDVHKGLLFPQTSEEQLVAIKTCKPEASDVERAKFLEEAAIMAKFNHRHIIKLFGVMSHDSTTYIIMELALVGQLRRYLMTEGAHVGYPVLLQYICQLCSAVVYLESKNFVHRDIAARNVLLATPELIKLADFGLSKRLEDTDYYVASKGKLPIKWMAPESINFRKFTGLSDVWMFGVCCWEILMKGVKPFVGVKNDEVINMIEMGKRLPLPPNCPAPLFDLLNQCWQYDPQDRPMFTKLEHMLTAIVEQERQDQQPRKASSGPSRQDPYAPIRQDPYASIRQDPYAPIRQDPNAPEKPLRNLSTSGIHGRGTQEASARWSGYASTTADDPPPPPPPRIRDTDDSHLRLNDRFRGASGSPNGDIGSPPLEPAPKPPRTDSPGSRDRIRPTPAPIMPYSVTTITPSEPTPPSFPASPPTYPEPRGFNGAIPPPSILRPAASRLSGDQDRVGYYSVPADPEEGLVGRMLSEDGTFVNKYSANKHISPQSSNRLSASSFPPPPPEARQQEAVAVERELDEFDNENDELLKQTMDIVKAVMEMSNKVPISRPADYVELIKNVGKALRELLTKVEMVEKTLPLETQNEINMATKVLSSDVTRLVDAMRDAQKNYQTFLEQEYQKQMLKAGHIIAVNAKQLLDTVNIARRKLLRTSPYR